MHDYKQFILWKMQGKLKLPVNPQGAVVDAHDSNNWLTYDECKKLANENNLNVGFVFTENDPYFFIDIDKCLEPCGTEWSPLAKQIIATFPGTYVEVSQSGKGLHIIGRGEAPEHSCKNIPLGLEFYTEERFVALTELNTVGNTEVNFSHVLPSFVDQYFKPKVTDVKNWTIEAHEDSNPIEDDEKLIKAALKSSGGASVFGGRASFADLWNANENVLAVMYPDDERVYDASSADAALAQHLCFWTGNNCERIQTLMNKSSLARDKWNREDYLKRTILNACSMQTEFFKSREIDTEIKTFEPQLVTGFQYSDATNQLKLFNGCVYVQALNKIFCPNGLLLKQEQFNATYGGRVFQLDHSGEKTTNNAWTAFTNSQCVRWPVVEQTCFRPELKSGEIIEQEGWLFVNSYVEIETPKQKGDVSLFLNHLGKILPIERDRQILLAYMAACVQYKGVKFQWCPVLQGAQGNGKTLFTRCVAHAVGRRYTHLPPANQISEKFNAWLFNKLFIGIEDIYIPDSKREIMEILKPMITNDDLAMREMQQSQIMGDNRANFIINSNHKTGLIKTRNDRRFCVFFTPQQTAEDCINAGMDKEYFSKLYDWLKHDGGYAEVAYFLEHYSIPEEFNPATKCQREPGSSSTAEAIEASMGAVEQEILEAIEQGKPGFSGGWVSSMAVARLLDDMKLTRSIPVNKRREMLQSLDYDWHPGLTDGRVNNYVSIDGGKPRLFIKKGHIHGNLTLPAEIVHQYEQSQTPQAANIFQKPTYL